MSKRLSPIAGILVLTLLWELSLRARPGTLLPRPWEVLLAFWELTRNGLLLRHVVASLFRVSWGFAGAAALAIPLGLALGWYRRGGLAMGPLLQVFRPISPLAWLPIAILWFGVGDLPAVFVIFLASVLPLTLSAMHAVRKVPPVYVNAGLNFGLSTRELLGQVILPAALPELMVGLRLTMGISWLVVVAAEMLAVTSGLGFLIVESRNAGNRYDLVVAGMVMIGVIGLGLDALMHAVARRATPRRDVVDVGAAEGSAA